MEDEGGAVAVRGTPMEDDEDDDEEDDEGAAGSFPWRASIAARLLAA